MEEKCLHWYSIFYKKTESTKQKEGNFAKSLHMKLMESDQCAHFDTIKVSTSTSASKISVFEIIFACDAINTVSLEIQQFLCNHSF